MVMYLLGALFFVQMLQSADQNAFAVVPNNQQFAIQPQIPVSGIPVQSDASGMLYQTLPCYQFINGAHYFAGMRVVPVDLNPWPAYNAYPQNYYPQENISGFGQSYSNSGAIGSSLVYPPLVPSEIPSEPSLSGPDAWEGLTNRRRDEVWSIESDVQKKKLGALFEVVQEEIASLAMPQPTPAFNSVPNSTKSSSTLSLKDRDKRIAALENRLRMARATICTYRSKSHSDKFSPDERDQIRKCLEKKEVAVKKIENEMKSLGVTPPPAKKRRKQY